MDALELGKGIGYGIGGVVATVLGLLGLRISQKGPFRPRFDDRRREGGGRREIDRLHVRMTDLERRMALAEAQVDALRNSQDRLDREAVVYRQEIREDMAGINVKLDQLLGWSQGPQS